jgi:hypothetical protein
VRKAQLVKGKQLEERNERQMRKGGADESQKRACNDQSENRPFYLGAGSCTVVKSNETMIDQIMWYVHCWAHLASNSWP